MIILEEESETIAKKLYAQLIPSRGANHNFPRVFQHAPKAFLALLFLKQLMISLLAK
jgi:hypothetical protein